MPELPQTAPVILIDTREQTPLVFRNLPSETAGLRTADYSVKGLEETVGIERKSISDLVASLSSGRERFERELHRLRGFDVARLLVVGEAGGTDPRHDIARGRCRARMKALVASTPTVARPRSPDDASKGLRRIVVLDVFK